MRRLVVFLLAVLLLPAMAQAQGRIALVIGNASYTSAVGPLVNSRRDASLVAQALRARGFQVTVLEDADRVSLLSAVDRYARALAAAGPGAVGFFYYSGHGIANPESKRNYLVPVDASTAADDRLWYQSVPLDDLVGTISRNARGATNLIVFDACRDQLALPRGRGLGGGKGLERIEALDSTLIAYSTAPNKTAADLDGASTTGPYATELAKALNDDGIDVRTMFENVKFAVLERTGRKQQPWVEDGLAQRVWLGKSAAPSPVMVVAAPSPAPPVAQSTAPAFTAIPNITPPATGTGETADTLYARGLSSFQANDFPGARTSLQNLVKSFPTSPRTGSGYYYLGRTHMALGAPATAAQNFYATYQKFPRDDKAPDSLYWLGQALVTLNKASDACKCYDELTEVFGARLTPQFKEQIRVARVAAKCSAVYGNVVP